MYTVHGRGADLSFFTFRPRSNIGTDNSASYSGATLGLRHHMHSHYLPTHLYEEHHTEK